MKKSLLVVFLISILVVAMGLVGCSGGEKASSGTSSQPASGGSDGAAVEGGAYGYTGNDPVELAVYKYVVEEVSKGFDKADASIPIVTIVKTDDSNPNDVLVFGDFWIDNYSINGNTLECVSGGNFPGVMHLAKEGDGYVVTSFDQVEDGSNFDSSAKELFGDNYDAFTKIYSDDQARAELRKAITSNYVKQNGLDVTQFQDYEHSPVELNK